MLRLVSPMYARLRSQGLSPRKAWKARRRIMRNIPTGCIAKSTDITVMPSGLVTGFYRPENRAQAWIEYRWAA